MSEFSQGVSDLVGLTLKENPVLRVAGSRALHRVLGPSLALESLIQAGLREPTLLTKMEVEGDIWHPPKAETRRILAQRPLLKGILEGLQRGKLDPVELAFRNAIDPARSIHAGKGDQTILIGNVAVQLINDLEGTYEPDIRALFELYLALFDRTALEKEDLVRLLTRSHAFLNSESDPLRLPPKIPGLLGSYGTSLQLAWAASRKPVSTILRLLRDALSDGSSKLGWAAAQFVEEAARYQHTEQPPTFEERLSPTGDSTSLHELTDTLFETGFSSSKQSSANIFKYAILARQARETLTEDFWTIPSKPGLGSTLASDGPSEEPSQTSAETASETQSASSADSREIDAAPAPPRPSNPRFADVLFRRDHHGRPGELLSDRAVLQAGRPYWLEVAVRRQPSGLKSVEPQRPVRSFRQSTTVLLITTLETDDFEVDSQSGVIELPPVGDSISSALFKVRHKGLHLAQTNPASIKVRIFYLFNLIEYLVVTSQVAQVESEEPYVVARKAQNSICREDLDLDDYAPRSMNIHVTGVEGSFSLQFTFADTSGNEIVISGKSTLSRIDIDDKIETLRAILESLTTRGGDYNKELVGTSLQFRDAVQRLAECGYSLYNALFGLGKIGSGLAALGKLLLQKGLEPGGLIQIVLPEVGDQFLFPWAFIYDRDFDFKDTSKLPDPAGFWGYRYGIEQLFSVRGMVSDKPVSLNQRLNLAFMLWAEFERAVEHTAFLANLSRESAGRVAISDPPITEMNEFYRRLESGTDSILYFYSHGEMRSRRTSAVGSVPSESSYSARVLPPVEAKLERSFIQLSTGKIFYEEMLRRATRLHLRPFVFLNLCESGQITPMFRESFVTLFLDLDARSVVGTECTMTINFARPFAEFLLVALFRGEMLADALLSARRHFLDNLNPLGLAYSLYGSGTFRIEPPCLRVPKPSVINIEP